MQVATLALRSPVVLCEWRMECFSESRPRLYHSHKYDRIKVCYPIDERLRESVFHDTVDLGPGKRHIFRSVLVFDRSGKLYHFRIYKAAPSKNLDWLLMYKFS
jgi:hypothetical protein